MRSRSIKPLSHDAWRKSVLLRDGHRCIKCGSAERLHADHILPVSAFPERMRDVSNGRTLCKICHIKTDTYGGKQLKGRRKEVALHGSR